MDMFTRLDAENRSDYNGGPGNQESMPTSKLLTRRTLMRSAGYSGVAYTPQKNPVCRLMIPVSCHFVILLAVGEWDRFPA
jgi:hypothetical protein